MNRYLLACLLFVPSAALADEKLKGIACRSVHLGYPAPAGTAFTTEMTVRRSADGTYFMACGWSKGYFGIQELADGKKVVLFSVWDPTAGDDPKKVDAEKRVKMLHQGDGVRVKRFGGEGTGGQSFFDYDWKVGEMYRFLVTAAADGKDRTAYAGYFYLPEKKEWKHLVTFSTITDGKLLDGYYSFIEDFRRNKISTTKPRVAEFGNGWVKSTKGEWVALTKARFTADANPVTNIDAKPIEGGFTLATGGTTENKGTTLRGMMSYQLVKEKPPADLPILAAGKTPPSLPDPFGDGKPPEIKKGLPPQPKLAFDDVPPPVTPVLTNPKDSPFGAGKIRLVRLKHDNKNWDRNFGLGGDRNLLTEVVSRDPRFKVIVAENSESVTAAKLVESAPNKRPPMLLVVGSAFQLSANEKKALRSYFTESHGIIFGDCVGGTFHKDFVAAMTDLTGVPPLEVPLDDPIHQRPFKISQFPAVVAHGGKTPLGWKIDGRWAVYYSPAAVTDSWRDDHAGVKKDVWEAGYQLGINVFFYAMGEHSKWLLSQGKLALPKKD